MWPLAVRAQQAMPVIGMLNSGPAQPRRDQLDGFVRGLRELGFTIGENVVAVQRGADDRYERLPGLAAELARLRVNVIAIIGGPVAALAARDATTTIPIVFAGVSDPIGSGLVPSLNRPGGNLTGSGGLATELDAKRLEIMGELRPAATTIGALLNPNRPGVDGQERDMRAAAAAMAREIVVFRAGTPEAIEAAFASMAARGIAALAVGADPFFANQRGLIVTLSARHAIAAIYQWREFVTEGGLASYGPSIEDAYRLAGTYVGRILRGERPGELPVVRPTKIELVLNLRTARAMSLEIPPTLLARADDVIE